MNKYKSMIAGKEPLGVTFRHHTLKICLLFVMPLLWLSACDNRTWEDVAVVETGSGEIRAGDLVRLEPTSFEVRKISGSGFSIEKFTFNGNLVNNSSDLELIGKVTLIYGSGGLNVVSTITGRDESIQWAANEPQKAITITFINFPDTVLSGDGYLYFYLTDLDGAPVSNIVKWPVTFVTDPPEKAELVEETAEQARSDALMEYYADKSIVVLPFVDLSGDAANESFSDGFSEQLINLLAQNPELRVIDRASSFAQKGRNVDIRDVAQKLNVDHVMEGSARKSGNRVRITAQLIEARSGSHLWSETYDRTLDDVSVIQDEIAAAVVAVLNEGHAIDWQ